MQPPHSPPSSQQQQGVGGWGAMGGSPGDGFLQGGGIGGSSTSTPNPGNYPVNPSMSYVGGMGGQPPPQQQQMSQQPQAYYPSVPSAGMPQQPQQPVVGSITRFANAIPMPAPTLQQQQQMPGSTVAAMPPVASGSFAARSAQAYAAYQPQQQQYMQQQQQQPTQQQFASVPQQQSAMMQPSVTTTQASTGPSTGQSLTARSAQAFANYQQQTQQGYPQPMAYPQPQQQQQQQPPYGTVPGNFPAGVPAGGSSFAARSQQAYQQQQQPMATPPRVAQPPPTYQAQAATPTATPTPDSFAARSAQAYGAGAGGAYPQQSVSNATTATSFAARGAQAYGGSAPPGQPVQNASPSFYGAAGAQQPQPGVAGYPNPQPPQPGYAVGGQYAPVSSNASMAGASTIVTNASINYAATGPESPQALQQQQRWLMEATKKVQEHAYYMKQAMEQANLPVVLDRAAHMVGELGGPPHGQHHSHSAPGSASSQASQQQPGSNNPNSSSPNQSKDGTNSTGPSNTGLSVKLTPKNYYELYMRALEEMPAFEDYLLNLAKPGGAPGTNGLMMGNQLDRIQIIDTSSPVQKASFTVRELYDCVQYCPRVLSRLYLQIAAGSALIRSGEAGAKWVLYDLVQAVKCEQNPIRGLFLRNFLLTALRDKLPDSAPPALVGPPAAAPPPVPAQEALPEASSTIGMETLPDAASAAAGAVEPAEKEVGSVVDSYEFILTNFMEMNKLWVRIQHLPGEGKNKDVKKRRERERNELRILVGTNLVRLSQLEGVTSKIYGESILPRILDHIVTTGDPLSQAYLMDCLVQVFPDEYHIETLPILLHVCPRLRDKVNIRTILQGLMDRLANYLAEEELLDESDTNQVKKALARDSFGLFEECVQNVYNARGPKLTAKEVIRLQTALLQFSLKCYPGNMEQVGRCLNVCVSALKQANASYDIPEGTTVNFLPKTLEEGAVSELEKLLSIPLEQLALKVLELEDYSALSGFLPWDYRRVVAVKMLEAVDNAGATPVNVREIQQLFSVIEPIIRDEPGKAPNTGTTADGWNRDPNGQTASLMAGLGVGTYPGGVPTSIEVMGAPQQQQQQPPYISKDVEKENALVSKLVHLLHHSDTDVQFEMLQVARNYISQGGPSRISQTLVAVIFAALKLARRVALDAAPATTTTAEENTTTVEKKGEVAATTAEDSKVEDAVKGDGPEGEKKDFSELQHDNKSESKEGEEQVAEKIREKAADNAKENVAGRTLTKMVNCRTIFLFVQETIAMLGKTNAEKGVKVYLEASLAADALVRLQIPSPTDPIDFAPVSYELLTQAYALYEEGISDSKAQQRCIVSMIGTLLDAKSIGKDDYESLITKTAQFAAKHMKKPEQCELVTLCAHLFFPVGVAGNEMPYSNAQRCLECLQRSLKLADTCTSSNPSNVRLFVELLDNYVFFFEKRNPLITHNYISGLEALIKEHLNNISSSEGVADARAHFLEVVNYIKRKKNDEATAELFAPILLENVAA